MYYKAFCETSLAIFTSHVSRSTICNIPIPPIYNFHQYAARYAGYKLWWNDDSKELGMLALTISFESVAEHSRARKECKYQGLVEAGRAVGSRVKLLPLEVGSKGMILDSDMSAMQSLFGATGRTTIVLVSNIIHVTLQKCLHLT